MKKVAILFLLIITVKLHVYAQLSCNANVNVSLGASGTFVLTPEMVLGGNTSSPYTYAVTPNYFTCSDVGLTIPVTVYQYLGSVEINSCFSYVTIEDKGFPSFCSPPPVACHSSLIISLDNTGSASLSPGDVLVGSPIPGVSYTVSPSNFDCADVGAQTVEIIATNPAGLSNSCFTTVIIVDRRDNPPPCISISMLNVFFFPLNILDYIIPNGQSIEFNLVLDYPFPEPSNTKATFIFALSEDAIFDKSDRIIYSENVHFKNKKNLVQIQNSFVIPKDLPAGKYFLLADVMSNYKKYEIGSSTFARAVRIGNSDQAGFSLKQPKSMSSHRVGAVYPNPTDGVIHFEITADESLVQIHNVMGQVIFSKKMMNGLQQLDLSSELSGAYLLRVVQPDGTQSITKISKL